MLGRHGLTLMLALALAACQGPKQPLPTTTKGNTPAPTASHGATSAPDTAPRHLQKPAGGSRTITGTLTLDAGYMASVGAGRTIESGYAVADASLVANNAGNIISEHGGGLISDNGGAILANNAGNLISNNGGGLTGKTKLGLLADLAPSIGKELPIGGMWVAVIGMKDGLAVPVGVDNAGNPVYVVHSDAHGRYELYLPPDLDGAVRVVAAVPDAKDARLNYNLLVAPTRDGDERFDEAAALTSDYVRRVLTGELVRLGTPTALGVQADDMLATAPPALAAGIRDGLQPFVDELERPEVRALSEVRRQRAMQHAIDTFLAGVDLNAMQTIPLLMKDPSPAEPVLVAAQNLFSTMQEKAAAKMAADPAYFDQKPYVLDANFRRAAAGLPPIAIKRPSDVGRFLVEEYTRNGTHDRHHNGWVVAVDLGLPATLEDRFHLVFESIYVGLSEQLVAEEATRDRLVAAERAALKTELAAQEPAPVPAATAPFELPKEASYALGALVNTGAPVRALAVGKGGVLYFSQGQKVRKLDPADAKLTISDVATLGQPGALAFDSSTGKLYAADAQDMKVHEVGGTATFVPGAPEQITGLAADGKGGLLLADSEAERVWRFDLADGGMSELVGGPRPDGLTPARANDKGAMHHPWGVAVAQGGQIYVSEQGDPRIWQLSADGVPSLLAGWGGSKEPEDGYFIGGGFKDPRGLAVAPDGSLLVVDHDNNKLRRVRASHGAGVVTTLDVELVNPETVAMGADGTIYLTQDGDPSIRVLKPRN